jgi:hypothetical protein
VIAERSSSCHIPNQRPLDKKSRFETVRRARRPIAGAAHSRSGSILKIETGSLFLIGIIPHLLRNYQSFSAVLTVRESRNRFGFIDDGSSATYLRLHSPYSRALLLRI